MRYSPRTTPLRSTPSNSTRTAVTDALCRYMAALVYNRAIPVIDERLTRLENPALAQRRDQELRRYIDALVRLRLPTRPPLTSIGSGVAGRELIDGMLRAVYEQLEEWE